MMGVTSEAHLHVTRRCHRRAVVREGIGSTERSYGRLLSNRSTISETSDLDAYLFRGKHLEKSGWGLTMHCLFRIGTIANGRRPRISGEPLKNRWLCHWPGNGEF